VQGVDLSRRRRHRLLPRFRFCARCALDDVSSRTERCRADVGPHIDSYDVFLLQVAGRRRLAERPMARRACADDVPMKMLAGFEASEIKTGCSERRHALSAGRVGATTASPSAIA
jgi:50S ribosomal protein L16 3-hydroxylase